MHLNELKALHVSEVLKQAEALEIENTGRMRKQELMFAIIKKRAKAGEQVFADGVLEILPDGFGFLRSPDTSYTASTDDIYISPSQVRRFNLHTGDMIEGEVRIPKDGERYFALTKLDKVNDGLPENNKHKVMFENLTPLFPKEQMRLERDIKGEENITARVIDIIAPLGRGQRALIVAQPKSGKISSTPSANTCSPALARFLMMANISSCLRMRPVFSISSVSACFRSSDTWSALSSFKCMGIGL